LSVNLPQTKKHSATQYHRRTHVFMYTVRYYWHILIKLEFSRQIFEKYSNVKYHENTSSGSRVVLCGRVNRQTDRQAGMTKLRVAFKNYPKAQKKKIRSYHAAWKDRVSHPTNVMHGSKSENLDSSLHIKAVIHSLYDHQRFSLHPG